MQGTSRPADPATLASAECEGCRWALIGDGDEAAQLALRAAQDHADRTGHQLVTLGMVPAAGTAAPTLAALMPDTAGAFPAGFAVAERSDGD